MIDVEAISENAGIYSLEHWESGRVYVGRSKNLRSRITSHMYELKRGIHCNKEIQEAYNKNPKFEVKILEEFDNPVNHTQLHRLESLYIQALGTTNIEKGFNIGEPSTKFLVDSPTEEIPNRRETIKNRQSNLTLTPLRRDWIEKEIESIERSLKAIKRIVQILD